MVANEEAAATESAPATTTTTTTVDPMRLASRWRCPAEWEAAAAELEAEPSPSELNTTNSSGLFAVVSIDKMSVKYLGVSYHGHDVGVVQADCPAPTRRAIYYFEMTVRNSGLKGQTSIGFTTESFKMRRQPGWESQSCGYHGDDGYLYRGPGNSESFGPKFTSGDIIGAGINYISQEFFFTKNGSLVGAFPKEIKGPLYPTIAVHSQDEELTVNFGKEQFCFDIEGYILEEKLKQQSVSEKLYLQPDISHWMANERWYYGLENVYDIDHRARLIENGEVLPPMRMRGHNASDMPYDVRFEEYFERAGLLPFVLQFKRPPPKINSTAITALLDRWRPETHSFHLPCGEMTVTLQDFAMITGLPIDGDALTGRVENEGWRARVTSLIGACPPGPEKETRSAGIPYTSLRENRGGCPANAGPVVVQQYARAFLWLLLTQVVFPDASGDTASWMYLAPLRDWDAKFSWGSAGLAFLYRQLDDACRRRTSGSSMGGCVWGLSVWMWERLPVGRPQKLQPTEWEGLFDDDDPYRLPTVAYSWDRVDGYTGKSKALYKSYINELDTLTYKQVNWMPYESQRNFPLNAMCTRDEHLWRTRCPMICFYAVEWHLPQRVAKQFGKRQRTPPEHESTGPELHMMTRQKCQKIRDWYTKHREWVTMWRKREEFVETDGTMDNEKAYLKHLEWFDDGEKYRLRLKPSWTQADCLELEEDGDDEYDMAVRESAGTHRDYAPVYDRVGLLLNRSINEAGVALQYPPGSVESDTALRSTVTRFVQRCRKMAAMLACHHGSAVDARAPTPSRTTSAAALSSRAGPSHMEEDEEVEEDEEEEQEEQEEYDEIRMS